MAALPWGCLDVVPDTRHLILDSRDQLFNNVVKVKVVRRMVYYSSGVKSLLYTIGLASARPAIANAKVGHAGNSKC